MCWTLWKWYGCTFISRDAKRHGRWRCTHTIFSFPPKWEKLDPGLCYGMYSLSTMSIVCWHTFTCTFGSAVIQSSQDWGDGLWTVRTRFMAEPLLNQKWKCDCQHTIDMVERQLNTVYNTKLHFGAMEIGEFEQHLIVQLQVKFSSN